MSGENKGALKKVIIYMTLGKPFELAGPHARFRYADDGTLRVEDDKSRTLFVAARGEWRCAEFIYE